MNKITVVIPTYNNINGLNYLLNYFKDKPYKVIIVDNNSKIKKFESLKVFKVHKVGKFIFLPQEKNLGFAKGINLGAKYADTEWMVILNDDIEFEMQNSKYKSQNDNLKFKIKKTEKEIFDCLINYAVKNKLEAVTPVLRNPDGRIENLGYKVLPYGKIQLIKNSKFEALNSKQIRNSNNQNSKQKSLENLNLKNSNLFRISDLGFRIYENLDGITAACLLIKTNVFKDLGGFDESFFAYLEDVEFFIRFKKAGYRFGIAPFEVFHHHMTTSKTLGSFKQKQDMINWWRLYFKHKNKFRFDLKFIIERLRNFSGFLKIDIKTKCLRLKNLITNPSKIFV